MIDLISRQAAIDAIKKHYRAHDNDLLEVIAFDIEQLPSAQPEIIRCHECSGFDDETEDDFGSGFCYMWGGETEANEFCSYAKRRKSDE